MEFKADKIDRNIVVPTLAEVVARLEQDPRLAPARRRDLISAVTRMIKLTGVDPRSTPASMRFMRPLLNAVRPAQHGFNPKTWSNLRANFRAAIVCPVPRAPRQHDPEWTKLRRLLPSERMQTGLCRFIGHCEDNGIPPTAVSDAVFDQFLEKLEDDENLWRPHDCHRVSCRLWNEAVASVVGWPQVRVTLPNYRRPRQSLPIGSYPRSLQDELAAYLAFLRNGTDRFARGPRQPKLAASTVGQREVEILLALSALVAAGRDPASITSLACLVEPDSFETVLRAYLKDDEEQTPRPFAHSLAVTLLSLARRWVKPGPEALEVLADLKKDLGAQYQGFAKKNDELLQKLKDPDTLARLLLLPERLADWIERAPSRSTRPDSPAVMMSLAVATAVLLCAPMRIANLAGLRLDRHLTRPGGPRSRWLIVIPSEDVKKTKVPLSYLLNREATVLVDRFIERHRAVLAAPGNPYLFPVGAKHKNPHDLSVQISRVIADWVGIDMSPHQFRHLFGELFEKHRPGMAAVIARGLGHTGPQTADKYYVRPNTLAAGRLFDEILEEELRTARLRTPHKRRRS